jgi:hypothetical protein
MISVTAAIAELEAAIEGLNASLARRGGITRLMPSILSKAFSGEL